MSEIFLLLFGEPTLDVKLVSNMSWTVDKGIVLLESSNTACISGPLSLNTAASTDE